MFVVGYRSMEKSVERSVGERSSKQSRPRKLLIGNMYVGYKCLMMSIPIQSSVGERVARHPESGRITPHRR